MPGSSHAAQLSSGRHTRHASKDLSISTSLSEQKRDRRHRHSPSQPTGSSAPTYNRSERSKSSSSHAPSSRRNTGVSQSPATPTSASSTHTQFNAVKSRTNSTSVATNGRLPPPAEHDDEHGGDTASLDLGDDEIVEDPFFQRYSFPQQPNSPPEELRSGSDKDESTDTEGPLSPTSTQMRPRPDSTAEPLGSPLSPRSPKVWPDKSPKLQEVNIAVLGSPNVGKTTFVQRAFDLPSPPAIPFTSRKMAMDGNIFHVRLIEMNYHDLDLDDNKCVCWPESLGGEPLPAIDGAFTLYDVMSKESLVQVPETLSGIYYASIPFLLVACKCDYPSEKRSVDPKGVDQRAKSLIGDVTTFETNHTNADTQKRCVAMLLRAIAKDRSHHIQRAAARRRAHTTTARKVVQVQAPSQKHHRANSEVSVSAMRTQQGMGYQTQQVHPFAARSKSHQQITAGNGQQSFLNVEQSSDNESGDSEHASSPDRGNAKNNLNVACPEGGYTFKELVERLLAQPISRMDGRFVSTFLALYRLFAPPSYLLELILQRFDSLNQKAVPQTIRASTQQRYLNIIGQWIGLYPGDFAHSVTRQMMEKFVAQISALRLFSAAARELAANLEVVVDDDDTNWAFSDAGRLNQKPQSNKPQVQPRGLRRPTDKTSAISKLAGNASLMSSSQIMLASVDQATRLSKELSPNPRYPLTKVQWHMLMDQPDDIIARELTRMDWVMFMSIRPRDLVRHVSLSSQQRSSCRHLANVQRLIDHFNRLAFWVSNLVLMRDKPKHRALMLEKMMRIARQLRNLNNYNSLGAILAGINSSSVHRLSATKELLNPIVGRDFMKLEILMSPQKSHSAYRLAWENTSGERLPYIPLHRRDLATAAEGNKTFLGESTDQKASVVETPTKKINWKKFEIMGDVVVGMQRAKEAPYATVQRHDLIASLVVEMEIREDEDKLYDRSLHVEPSSGGANAGKKRFHWFQQGGGGMTAGFP